MEPINPAPNPRTQEATDLFQQLPPEQQELILALIKSLSSKK